MEYQHYVHPSGMLRVDTPSSWTVREYPADPRAKVEFCAPTDSGVKVRLIATPAKGKRLDEVLPNLEERKMQMLALGAQAAFTDVVIRGVEAVKVTARRAGAEQVLYLFVDAEMYCNFSFECPPKRFGRYWPMFEAMLLSAELQPPESVRIQDERNRLVASRIRRARVCLEHGNITLAREAVREGLEIDPRNQELLELHASVERASREEQDNELPRDRVAWRWRIIGWRLMTAALPMIGLIAIDLTEWWYWLAPVLIATPFLDLRRQLHIWHAHIRAFGFPSATTLRTMLRLDALRGYDAYAGQIRGTPQRSLWQPAMVILLAGIALAAIGYFGRWVTPFYGASICSMLVLKSLLRRPRPPAVLLLGGSGSEVTLLHLTINEAIKPLEAVSLLRHTPTSPMVDARLMFLNFRTGDDAGWRNVVGTLVSISGLLVLDLRVSTDAVRIEREICRNIADKSRLFVVSDKSEVDFPASRCFSAYEVTTHISEHLDHRLARVK